MMPDSGGVTLPNGNWNRQTSQPASITSYIVREQVINFRVVGLKPNTRHYFYFDNVDKSAKCAPGQALNTYVFRTGDAQLAGRQGDPLVSDARGNLNFAFFYDSDIDTTTNYTELLSVINRVAGVKQVRIQSSDQTSSASYQITILGNQTSNFTSFFTTVNGLSFNLDLSRISGGL